MFLEAALHEKSSIPGQEMSEEDVSHAKAQRCKETS
jgi:hypothetical protein